MIITEEEKKLICIESDSFLRKMYGNNTKEDRKKFAQYYTPPSLVIKLIENFSCTREQFSKMTILDPTCGSGNLLIGCLLCGANPNNIYGVELDTHIFYDVLIPRLQNLYKDHKWKFNRNHFHIGDATNEECLKIENFTENYKFIDGKVSFEVEDIFSL